MEHRLDALIGKPLEQLGITDDRFAPLARDLAGHPLKTLHRSIARGQDADAVFNCDGADAIGEATGVKPTTTNDGVVRIAWARTDVPVKVDGMSLKPFAGLGSWATFMPSHGGTITAEAMVMGDTVVFEDEVTPAMDAAF